MSGAHAHHHGGGTSLAPAGSRRFALVGSPNAGKTTLFNGLTGLRAKTGNYPGVTVARYEGTTRVGDEHVAIEDLPGLYSLDPISPDEEIVVQVLDPDDTSLATPDGLVVLLDATTLRRSLTLFTQIIQVGLPTCVVLTFSDELAVRGGAIDVPALERALGVPVVAITSADRGGVEKLRARLADADDWPRPAVPPPTDPEEVSAWTDSVLAAASYRPAGVDERSRRIDAILLHPVLGTGIFFAVMFGFFQTIFTLAAPLQGGVESFFGWLGELVATHISTPWLASFLGEAIIGGIGGVLVFLPQILLLFLLISILEGVGYLSRAAFLMDRVMASAGLEGRAFVALLSSLACAIPGIMATRTLPSARDRIATMLAAPLMTCSARLPVYVLLISLLIDSDARVGPFGAQGTVMFGLYLLGAAAAMTTAWVFTKVGTQQGKALPFYMEMPPYRVPRMRTVFMSMWESALAFLRKVTTIILAATIILWFLLNLPLRGDAEMAAAGVDVGDDAAVSSYVVDHSYAASLGKAVEPVFEPLGFDWRINVGVIASLSAREVFVATIGQIAAADNPEDPAAALSEMTVEDGPRAGQPLFDAATGAALLVFFVFALQCMSTVGVMRRETGSWRWPAIAFGYMFVLAWTFAFLAHTVVAAVIG